MIELGRIGAVPLRGQLACAERYRVCSMANVSETSDERTGVSSAHDTALSVNLFSVVDSESAMPIPSLTSPVSQSRTSKQGPTKNEWDAMRSDIKRLYIEEGRTLKETRFILSLVYHFHPHAS